MGAPVTPFPSEHRLSCRPTGRGCDCLEQTLERKPVCSAGSGEAFCACRLMKQIVFLPLKYPLINFAMSTCGLLMLKSCVEHFGANERWMQSSQALLSHGGWGFLLLLTSPPERKPVPLPSFASQHRALPLSGSLTGAGGLRSGSLTCGWLLSILRPQPRSA